MQIHWSGATRYHDWMENGVEFPKTMIRRFSETGLLGNLDWVQTGIHKKKEELLNGDSELLINYLGFTPKRNDLYTISAGGTNPFEWKLTLGLFPLNKETKTVKGYNIINLWVEKDELLTQTGADSLFALFCELHKANNTEYAFIHPYDRWFELSDYFKGAYGRPVTFSPMFTGVCWSTFLGRGQLELFDGKKIKNISSDKIMRNNEFEIYIRMSKIISDVLNKDIEDEMISLTEKFRAALI